MSKITSFIKKDIFIFLLLLFSIPSFITLIRPGYFTMHDDLQAFRIHQMDKCFQDFQFPCRWVPDMGYQYGYPQYNFYPPSPYYLGEVFHLLGFQFIDSAKLLFIFGFLASAFSMYFFLRSWLSKLSAFLGAILYTYVPYKAVEVYVRGAVNEFWSLVFFPLAFWSSYLLIKKAEKKNIAFFAVSVALLLLTHNLMTLIFIPVLGVWVLANIYLEKKYKSLIQLVLGGLLGLGLAAFFTLPVTFEKQYAHLETLLGGYFDYRQHFVDLNQLFISNFWGYGSSLWGSDDGLSLSTGHIQWIAAMFAVIFAAFFFKRFKKVTLITLLLGISELLILFMMHQKSSEIWSYLHFLEWLQFPWRFMAVSIFLVSIMSAVLVYFIEQLEIKVFKIKAVYIISVILILGVFVLYLPFFKPHTWLDITDRDKFSGISWDKQLTISIFDYLPIYAKLPPTSPAPENPETLEGLADFSGYKKGSDFQMGRIVVYEEALIRLPLFDFPGMKVWVDGKEVPHSNDDCRNQEFCLGLITFKVPSGEHFIKAELTDTPVRTAGNSISLVSILITLGLLFKFKNEKNNS